MKKRVCATVSHLVSSDVRSTKKGLPRSNSDLIKPGNRATAQGECARIALEVLLYIVADTKSSAILTVHVTKSIKSDKN